MKKFGMSILLLSAVFFSCNKITIESDFLIINGLIIDGTGNPSYLADIAIKGTKIVFVGDADTVKIKTIQLIDATGLIISPGFIDSHTHSLGDLKSKKRSSNLNYLTQGVTTVMNGNDGGGPIEVDSISTQLMANGIGTNTAFLVGHGTVRNAVLGGKNVAPDSAELKQMQLLVTKAMQQGAFGFSTGLYYAPGSFSTTQEVIALAKEVKPFGGLYESHIRDESTYNIGLINAVKEAIQIGEEAGVPVHLAHIKALGIDVWHKSNEIIKIVENAQKRGIIVTADQYPWKASGTHIENALIDRWVMAGTKDDYYARLNNKTLLLQIKNEIKENLRKRGGADKILITADCYDTTMVGSTLEQIANNLSQDPVTVTLNIAKNGGARIASFNMNEEDVANFMKQPWVMTCSDGTKGHPRKFASYPQKYKEYVLDKQLLTMEEFIYKNSGLVAQTFGIKNRGIIKTGNKADIIVFDKEKYRPSASYYKPAELTKGMIYIFVNGNLTIEQGKFLGNKYGIVIRKNKQ